VVRRYVEDTMVLETEFETATGRVVVVDFMPVGGEADDLIRIVRGIAGRVEMRMELVLRFEYGSIVPWVEREGTRVHAIAGPDAVCLDTPVETHGRDFTTVAHFAVQSGDEVPFTLRWHPSHGPPPAPLDPHKSLLETVDWWRTWASHSTYQGPWRREVTRSLLVLKALTYAPTGGVVAAPTTSLPEQLGGERNWDYRYCWARDAAFTLSALLAAGYRDEARAWRDWLVRAAA
jgi:GH15 family glucan-1,4-alpha-glucosidase